MAEHFLSKYRALRDRKNDMVQRYREIKQELNQERGRKRKLEEDNAELQTALDQERNQRRGLEAEIKVLESLLRYSKKHVQQVFNSLSEEEKSADVRVKMSGGKDAQKVRRMIARIQMAKKMCGVDCHECAAIQNADVAEVRKFECLK